jgi:hypothetical protein
VSAPQRNGASHGRPAQTSVHARRSSTGDGSRRFAVGSGVVDRDGCVVSRKVCR